MNLMLRRSSLHTPPSLSCVLQRGRELILLFPNTQQHCQASILPLPAVLQVRFLDFPIFVASSVRLISLLHKRTESTHGPYRGARSAGGEDMGSVLSTIQTVQLKCGSIPFSLALVSHLWLPKLCSTPGLAKIVVQVLKALNVPLFSFA